MKGLSVLARAWLGMCSALVPAVRRAEWVEEWAAEILAARPHRTTGISEQRLLLGATRDAWATRQLMRARERSSRVHARRERSEWLRTLRSDFRQAFRSQMARPIVTVVSVLTFAAGVGATTVMFTAIQSILLRPLPYQASEDIVVLRQTDDRDGTLRDGVSAANMRDVGTLTATLSHVAVASAYGFTLMADGRAHSVRGWHVSSGFFEAIGGRASIGRTFRPEEYVAGSDKVVLLAHRTWQSRFGGDRDVVGRSLILDGQTHTITGVLPPEFKYPSGAELWAPRPPQPWDEEVRAGAQMTGVARLQEGVSLEQASAELDRIASRLGEMYPTSNASSGFHLTPLRDELFGDVRFSLVLLLGAGALVLLIACVNVASLQLARGSSRGREYALRRALGASSASMGRLVCMENLLLAVAGGAAGIAIASVAVPGIRLIAPLHVPRIDELAVDWVVLSFAFAISVASALVAGIAPALSALRTDPQQVLADSSRGTTTGRRATGIRHRLVVIEIAMAMLLTIGAGLLVRSLGVLLDTEPGFDPSNRLVAQVFAYDDQDRPDLEFMRRATDELAGLPDVEAVGLTTALPLADNESLWSMHGIVPFSVDGRAIAAGSEPVVRLVAVDSGYVRSIGAVLRDGRNFDARDDSVSPRVAMVNEAFARRHFADGAAIGRRIVLTRTGTSREIVGILGDVRSEGLEVATGPELYIPYYQSPGTGGVTFVVKASTPRQRLAESVTDAIWRTDPGQSIWAVHSMEQLYTSSTRERRFSVALLAAFSGLALFLACIGVYGLLSFTVAQRVNELGVRRALGAGTTSIFRVVLKQGLVLSLIGVALGVLAAMLAAGMLRSLLFGVAPLDPITFVTVSAIVVAVSVVAALLPAWRASRVDPASALRAS